MGFFNREAEIKELRGRVKVLENQVGEIKRFCIQEALNEFRNARDESGKLLHPRIKELDQVMCDLLKTKQATTLEQAYAMASMVQN